MIRRATDYLDHSSEVYPDKPAFIDERRAIIFRELQEESYHIASRIIELGLWKQPVIVYLNKSVECIAAFMGTAYSGNFYSPVDVKMPSERVRKITEKLKPSAIITDSEHKLQAEEFAAGITIIDYGEAQKTPANVEAVNKAKERIIDADVLYVLFTSGSTGTPKGAIISHRGIIDHAEWFTEKLGYSNESIIANQTPFYFSMSVIDIYLTLKNGASTYIIPEELFLQPAKLMRYLDDNKINTIYWVPSILQILSTFNALDRPHVSSLKNIYFAGEVLQTKHLNRWRKEYPDANFVNLFGPTEVTDICMYYEVSRDFSDDERLPIGRSCGNKDCFILDEDNRLITEPDIQGEICVRGSCLAYGYYNDHENTAKAFVQNPLNTSYSETIYRTGDLAMYNHYGEIMYMCRKDFQIKHLGRRIELGEIEAAVSAVEGIEDCCCLYDTERLRITLYYVGGLESSALEDELKKSLPDYMLPGKYMKLPVMPHNLNGKIDRQKLKSMMKE